MKPIGLTMHAFGPYAGKQELDFNALQGRSFFLIHGPTGSGKTTILDAICYALYGDTSGAVRDGKTMRSDHAGEDELTKVCFDFVIGAVSYRVERCPEQERPKKNGQGRTRVKPEAALWRLNGEQEAVLATGWEAVTRYVEGLIGFKSSQFRQVVLLPQGDFRRLLTANSAERQEIMQVLFKTGLFQQIEEKLKSKAQELKQQYDSARQEAAWVLQAAAAESGEELRQRLLAEREQAAGLSDSLAQVDQTLKLAQGQLAQGQLLQANFTEAAAAGQTLRTLAAALPGIGRQREELANGLKAAALRDAERAVAVLTADREQGKAELSRIGEQYKLAAVRQADAARLLAAEAGREPEREEAIRQIHQLNEIESKAAQLQQSAAAVREARLQSEQAAAAARRTGMLLKNAQAETAAKTEHYQQVLRIAAEAQGRRLAVEEAERRLARRNRLEAVRAELAAAGTRAGDLAGRLLAADGKLREAKQQLAALQEAWETGQAAILAASLQPGSACPVCGSLHHPDKAQSSGLLPDNQEIKDCQRQLQQAEAGREALRQQTAQADGERDLLAGRVGDLTQELGETASASPQQLAAALQRERERYQQSVIAERERETLALRLEQLAAMQQNAAEELECLDNAQRAAESRLQAAETVAAERQAAVPPQYRELQQVKQAQLAAANRQQLLKTAYEQAQTAAGQANHTLAQLETAQSAATAALAAVAARLEAETAALLERLAAAGFAGMADFQAAKRQSDRLEQLERQLNLFDRQLAAARERATRAEAAVAGLQPPDLAGLQEQLESAKAAYGAILAEQTALGGRVRQAEQWLLRLQELQQSLSRLESRYAVFGRLSEVANGRNEFGLTLQRFVLGALLDDVAIAANERLKTMSRGRYQLQRTMDRARRNSAGGLELEVFDNYTGAARPVTTLSGGETFLASLSLALGLADVVQSYAGGIHLDAIFVDEGFGTLDPETLEFALQALIALQQGGRLVGIISHVPELKDRIDARLEVTVSAQGSKAAFQIGPC